MMPSWIELQKGLRLQQHRLYCTAASVILPQFNDLCHGCQEIVINISLMLRFLAAGVTSAVFASKWGGPPPLCPDPADYEVGDVCDSVPLNATNALQCVSI